MVLADFYREPLIPAVPGHNEVDPKNDSQRPKIDYQSQISLISRN